MNIKITQNHTHSFTDCWNFYQWRTRLWTCIKNIWFSWINDRLFILCLVKSLSITWNWQENRNMHEQFTHGYIFIYFVFFSFFCCYSNIFYILLILSLCLNLSDCLLCETQKLWLTITNIMKPQVVRIQRNRIIRRKSACDMCTNTFNINKYWSLEGITGQSYLLYIAFVPARKNLWKMYNTARHERLFVRS